MMSDYGMPQGDWVSAMLKELDPFPFPSPWSEAVPGSGQGGRLSPPT